MSLTAEHIKIPLTPAELIGLDPQDAEWLTSHHVHELGALGITGSDSEPAFRFHTGPKGSADTGAELDSLIHKGGIKYKQYPDLPTAITDGFRHSDAMLTKSGIIDETGYTGGKGIIVGSGPLNEAQGEATMRAYAHRMHRQELADPRRDVPAGDEGTNKLIQYYRDQLIAEGMSELYANATITGKPGMRSRPAATGLGAAVVHQTDMALRGRATETNATQGAGFAGLYYAAHVSQPRMVAGEPRRVAVKAIGAKDLADPNPVFSAKRPQTLHTSDPYGLRISPEMVDSVLLNGKHDPDMQANGNDPLLALAAKLEREGDRTIGVTYEDVLSYPAETLTPAATSKVVNRRNIGDIKAKRLFPIANVAVDPELLPHLTEYGIVTQSGPLTSAGGIYTSIQEHKLDLRRLGGETDVTEDVEAVNNGLINTMSSATRAAHNIAQKYDVSFETAAEAVGLARHAMHNNVQIDPTFRQLITG
jgi:glutamate dehydrogenase/leucine dehydrogenase